MHNYINLQDKLSLHLTSLHYRVAGCRPFFFSPKECLDLITKVYSS